MAANETTGVSTYDSDYTDRITLSRAVVAGIVGGIAFGIPLQYVIGRMAAVGALYNGGEPSIAIGWAAHLVHSAVFGLAFGMISEHPLVHKVMSDNVGIAAIAGLVFGLALWSVNMVFVWPIWLDAVGFTGADDLSVPFLAFRPLAGHFIYGVILGTVFFYLVDY